MVIIPAIDLYNGNVVRLYQGKKQECTVYSNDPIAMAKELYGLGASLIHVVDLNASFGDGDNEKIIAEMIASGIPVETGGGIRTIEKARRLIEAGARKLIIGTKATDEAFLDSVLTEFGENVAVGVDVLDGMLRTKGWQEKTSVSFLEFVAYLKDKGVKTIIYTDISKDGTLAGPSIDHVKKLRNIPGPEYIVSGGIGSMDDLLRVRDETPFVSGIIVGKAFYEGKVDLKEAFSVFSSS